MLEFSHLYGCIFSIICNLTMKIPLILIIFGLFLVNAKEQYTMGDRPRSIECIGDNETIRFDLCNVKAYSRKLAVYNIHLTFLKTLERPFFVHAVYLYRFGTIYREMLNSGLVDYCEVMDGKSLNLVLDITITNLKMSVPHLLHSCPYKTGKFIRI